LNWVALLIALALTAVAIYDIANGERNFSVWLSIICWPIVVIGSAVQLARIRRDG
jgi:hypothetical protein